MRLDIGGEKKEEVKDAMAWRTPSGLEEKKNSKDKKRKRPRTIG